jgi:imidazolonepropionase-like amidohydrolase
MSSPNISAESTVILGATLIDGTGQDPMSNAAIVIEGGRIKEVGRRDNVLVPRGATVLHADGKTLLPGLIDCHVRAIQFSERGCKSSPKRVKGFCATWGFASPARPHDPKPLHESRFS